MSHLSSNVEGEKCRVLSPSGRRGRSQFVDPWEDRLFLPWELVPTKSHEFFNSWIVDGTFVFSEENAISKAVAHFSALQHL